MLTSVSVGAHWDIKRWWRVLSLDVRVVTITMIKMLSAEQLNTNRNVHGEEEVRDGEGTRISKSVFFLFSLSLRSIRRQETVPRAESARLSSGSPWLSPCLCAYLFTYNLLTDAFSTPEYTAITSEVRMNKEMFQNQQGLTWIATPAFVWKY